MPVTITEAIRHPEVGEKEGSTVDFAWAIGAMCGDYRPLNRKQHLGIKANIISIIAAIKRAKIGDLAGAQENLNEGNWHTKLREFYPWVLENRDCLAAFVGGFFDARGCVTYGRLANGQSWAHININLFCTAGRDELLRILEEFGIQHTSGKLTNKDKPEGTCLLTINRIAELHKFAANVQSRLPEKQDELKKLLEIRYQQAERKMAKAARKVPNQISIEEIKAMKPVTDLTREQIEIICADMNRVYLRLDGLKRVNQSNVSGFDVAFEFGDYAKKFYQYAAIGQKELVSVVRIIYAAVRSIAQLEDNGAKGGGFDSGDFSESLKKANTPYELSLVVGGLETEWGKHLKRKFPNKDIPRQKLEPPLRKKV